MPTNKRSNRIVSVEHTNNSNRKKRNLSETEIDDFEKERKRVKLSKEDDAVMTCSSSQETVIIDNNIDDNPKSSTSSRDQLGAGKKVKFYKQKSDDHDDDVDYDDFSDDIDDTDSLDNDSSDDDHTSSGEGESSSDGDRNLMEGGWTKLRNTVSKSIFIKRDIDRKYILVKKRNSDGSMKQLKMPEKCLKKVIGKISLIKRRYAKLMKRYRKKHDKRNAKRLDITKQPCYKATLMKMSNFWYIDLRRYKNGNRYERNNGVCFPVKDFIKTFQHLDSVICTTEYGTL